MARIVGVPLCLAAGLSNLRVDHIDHVDEQYGEYDSCSVLRDMAFNSSVTSCVVGQEKEQRATHESRSHPSLQPPIP